MFISCSDFYLSLTFLISSTLMSYGIMGILHKWIVGLMSLANLQNSLF